LYLEAKLPPLLACDYIVGMEVLAQTKAIVGRTTSSMLSHLMDDRRYAAMTGLGFASGLPFLLVYSSIDRLRI
jgi:hypothetical protein